MGKILNFFIIFLLCVNFAQAASKYDRQLSQFDKEYKSASDDRLLKYHHMLKNIYIQSIIKNDLLLKIKTLQRLIITSSKLGLDSKAYKKELTTLKKMAGKKGSRLKIVSPDISTNKSVKKSNKNIKTLFPTEPIAKKTPKKVVKKRVYKNPQKVISSKARIVKIQQSSKGISLIFDRKISDVDVKTFALKGSTKGKNTYRYIYDIGAILLGKSKSYKIADIDKIRVGQYNKKVVRVVFTDNKKLKLYYSKIDNTINIGYKGLRAKIDKPKAPIKQASIPISAKNEYRPNSKIIVIDAGHGGKDGGAQGARGLSEKKVVLQIALKVGKELKARGFKIYYTRTRDKFIKLRSRTKMANRKKADLFVSIHANAAPNRKKYKSMHGIETFFLSPARSKRSKNVAALENRSDIAEMDYFSKQTFLNFMNREKIVAANKLAIDVQQAMLNSVRKKYKVSDGGVREAPFWVLVGAQMPSILVEVGYITNPTEGKRIASKSYQNLISNGIANGIASYFDKN